MSKMVDMHCAPGEINESRSLSFDLTVDRRQNSVAINNINKKHHHETETKRVVSPDK